jgi:hypothetical protein
MGTEGMSVAEEIDGIIAKAGGWRGDALARARRVVSGADPEISEAIKWRKPSKPEGVATWVCDGNICMADLLKAAVRLTFPKGASIDDPDGLFNARLDSGSVRAIDFFEGAEIDDEALRDLVRRAVALNRQR